MTAQTRLDSARSILLVASIKMALNVRQRRFIAAYIKNPNATQAALAVGYSPRTAHSIGSENLQKPEIAAAIGEAFQNVATPEQLAQKWSKLALAEPEEDSCHFHTKVNAGLKAGELLARYQRMFEPEVIQNQNLQINVTVYNGAPDQEK